MFSYEFCEILKNTYFIEYLWTTASEHYYYTNLKSLEYSFPYSSRFQLQKNMLWNKRAKNNTYGGSFKNRKATIKKENTW